MEVAFAAHTVGGRRAARDDATGELVPGAPATLAIWRIEGVGSGAFPDLDGPDPVCLGTVIGGDEAFVQG
jgi:hypothetical protein